MAANFSTATMETIGHWKNTFKILREDDFKSRILYPAKISVKYETEIKFFLYFQVPPNSHASFLNKLLENALHQKKKKNTWEPVNKRRG